MSPTSDIQIDPRGYRFGALMTLVVVLAALVAGAEPGRHHHHGRADRDVPARAPPSGPRSRCSPGCSARFVRPRIGPPSETESFRPPRFAQQMGLFMAAAALILGLAGVDAGFYVFAALIAIASFLNGVFNFCAGCEIYLLFKRATTKAA